MADVELVKKMLRAVLQANKSGVSLSRLQSEYKELTGEQIPHKQLGHNHLDALLASMPAVVRMDRNRSGEVCEWEMIMDGVQDQTFYILNEPFFQAVNWP